MNTKRFSLLLLTAVFLLSLTPIFAQESTETPDTEATELVSCDADLILSLYTAQRFFGFDSFNSQMSSDTMLDIDSFDKGQYTILFDGLSTSDAVEISDARHSSMMDMMLMSDADFDAHVVSMAAGDTTTNLTDGFADESEECAALRQILRRFYLSLALSDAETSDAGTDESDSDTDSSGDGEEAPAGTITANLSGASEVPGPGDEDASGTATVYLRSDTNEVCVDITVQNITFPATAAHIHQAAAGQSGPPVVTLNTPTDDGLSSTCATVDAALMQELVNNPQNFYINVHNGEFPDGAARGQLQ
jgi:hypothetical protein